LEPKSEIQHFSNPSIDGEAPDMSPVGPANSSLHHIGGDDLTGYEPDYGDNRIEVFSPVTKENGKFKRDSIENTIAAIETNYKGLFVLNEFADEIFLCKRPPWDNSRQFVPRPFDQYDIINLSAKLERLGLDCTNTRTADAIKVVAHNHKIHPLRVRLNRMVWDGKPRLATWLRDYMGSTQNAEYLAKVGTSWLVGGAARIFNAGIKFDHMLVLEGTQGSGKSSALRMLATFDGKFEYFCDNLSFAEINDRKAIQQLQGRVIIEIAELDGMGKKDDTELKKWITLQSDEIQKKYENAITRYPRQFILAGTTNKDEWLRDPSGNRRYWPVKVGKIDFQAIADNREQLWAEAVHVYKSGEKFHIDHGDRVYALVEQEQASRLEEDVWESAITSLTDGLNHVKLDKVLKEIIPDLGKQDGRARNRVINCLKKIGFKNVTRWTGKKAEKVWERVKPIPEQMPLQEPEYHDIPLQ